MRLAGEYRIKLISKDGEERVILGPVIVPHWQEPYPFPFEADDISEAVYCKKTHYEFSYVENDTYIYKEILNEK